MRALRLLGILLLTVVGLLLVTVVLTNLISINREQHVFEAEIRAPRARSDSTSIERGRHLATIAGCTECHGQDFAGTVMVDQPMTMGRLVAPNITAGKGSATAGFEDGDWVRAIRHGLRKDGTPLVIMPSDSYQSLSDGDLASLIGYLRTVPPVDREMAKTQLGPLGRTLHVLAGIPLLPAEKVNQRAESHDAPEPGATQQYGEYLANASGCRGCHGANLAGVNDAPNLTPAALGAWTDADFQRALREGKRPNGDTISVAMPWRAFSHMTDDEIRALWLYLKSVPPVEPKKKS